MNTVIVTGRITHDLELRVTNNNKHVFEFQIAIKKNKDESMFIRVQTWENTADYINNFAMKGSLLAITGRLDCQKYTDREGRNVEKLLIVSNNVEVIDRKKGEQTENRTEYKSNVDVAPDDLPFY